MTDRLEELYLAFTFDLVATEPLAHLHWGLWRDIPEEPDRLVEAQARYAEAFVAAVPRDADRILDVGAGLGGIAASLAGRGHHVAALTPRSDHAAAIRSAKPKVEVIEGRFEDLGEEAFDAIVFAESFAFFVARPEDVAPWLDRCRALLAPGGTIVLADLVAPDVGAELARHDVMSREDWSAEVAFTIDALEARFRRARAYGELMAGVLRELDAALASAVEERLANVPNEALRALFRGQLVERSALAERPYELFVIRP